MILRGEHHPAVPCDFEKGQALGKLGDHVFEVAALHELGPEGDLGACIENGKARVANIEIGHAAYACGQKLKVQRAVLFHSDPNSLRGAEKGPYTDTLSSDILRMLASQDSRMAMVFLRVAPEIFFAGRGSPVIMVFSFSTRATDAQSSGFWATTFS